jgi:hypothetical protein
MLRNLEQGIFDDCTKLLTLSLSANNISEISRYAFDGLKNLEYLDLSNNNIVQLDPLVFDPSLISTNGHFYQLLKLKYISLAENKLRALPFKLYFPWDTDFVTFYPKYERFSLNVSSNLLDSLDEPSVRWLKQTASVTDLSGNPWKCECSALGEAWRELGHSLTLVCASPEGRRGRTWDVLILDKCTDTMISVDIPDSDKMDWPILDIPHPTIVTTHTVYDPERLILFIFILLFGGVCTCLRWMFCGKRKKNKEKVSELPDHSEVCVDHNDTVRLVPTS